MLHFPRDPHRREWRALQKALPLQKRDIMSEKEPGLQGFLEGGVTGFILRQPLSGLSE